MNIDNFKAFYIGKQTYAQLAIPIMNRVQIFYYLDVDVPDFNRFQN